MYKIIHFDRKILLPSGYKLDQIKINQTKKKGGKIVNGSDSAKSPD